ncbi:MAG: helix-turn-helix domain-containing protein [Ruminococcus sp.]|nr:helix-turn-helix domain-containing protein [Ruminococcus sp.]
MLMSMKEYAEHVGVSYNTIYRMCKNGDIPSVRFGKRRKIDPAKAMAKLEADEKTRLREKEEKARKRQLAYNKPAVDRIRTQGEFLAALKAL